MVAEFRLFCFSRGDGVDVIGFVKQRGGVDLVTSTKTELELQPRMIDHQ